MKTFLVILQVTVSQYEKHTKLLVVAEDENEAVELAFKLEAHSELIQTTICIMSQIMSLDILWNLCAKSSHKMWLF